MSNDLVAELAAFAAELEREVNRRVDVVISELRASIAERLMAFGDKQAEVREALQSLSLAHSLVKDGSPGPPGPPGPPGEQGPAGMLREVKAWQPAMVCYAGDLALCGGSTWQARVDTATSPGSDDWSLVAASGRDGKPLNMRGKYDGQNEPWNYKALDVVMLDGGSFVALVDNPGACPGDGWRALALRGPRGSEGPRGEPGARGRDCPPLALEVQGTALIVTCGDQVHAVDLEPVVRSINLEAIA